MPSWYVLHDRRPLSAPENMARDEFLFQLCHREKLGFLRLYSWEKPTFSFGVSQRLTNAIDLKYIRENNLAFVRRLTGGKTVLHDDEITYAVASSDDVFYRDHDLFQSYLLISKIIVDALGKIGLEAVLSSKKTTMFAKSNHPCFSFPTLNEIEIRGRKIVGSAQKRDKIALLQHGSIPFSMDYERYSRGTGSSRDFIKANMITLAELSSVSKEAFIGHLIGSFQKFINESLETYEFNEHEQREIGKIAEKYRSEDWNFRL
jgi:lipoate-protein ligase A